MNTKQKKKQKEAESKILYTTLYFLTILNTFSYDKRIMKYDFINDDSETEEDNEDVNDDIKEDINEDDNIILINQSWNIPKQAIKKINKS